MCGSKYLIERNIPPQVRPWETTEQIRLFPLPLAPGYPRNVTTLHTVSAATYASSHGSVYNCFVSFIMGAEPTNLPLVDGRGTPPAALNALKAATKVII